MAKNINPSRMRIRLEFGKYEPSSKINPNTGKRTKSEYRNIFTKWAGKWTISQTQQISLAGAGITNAVVFFIRHSDLVTSDLIIRWKGNKYIIDSIAYDDGIGPDGFDLITCHQEVVKHG